MLSSILALGPVPAAADPEYRGPVLYGLDPVLRATRNPRLLGVDRLVLRERLLQQGVDPYRNAVSPSFATTMRRSFETRMNVKLAEEAELVEASGFTGLYTLLRYPEWFYLVPARRALPDGFEFFPSRRLDAPEVEVYVDDLEAVRQRNLAVHRRVSFAQKLDVDAGRSGGPGDGLINFTIPIKLPRTLESIIGRGEKTQIRISGRERIAIRGENTRSSDFVGNENTDGQSWFPDLNMEQQLQVKLDGQIGEKIFIEVEHDSEAIGPEGTKIKLAFRGDEDEIIQSIETGDVGLTLPGGQLLGYNSNESGLFGIKVTGQLGPAAFTVVASKQKAESDSKTFNSSGGQQTPHPVKSSDYLNNRFFRLDLPPTLFGQPGQLFGYSDDDNPGRGDGDRIVRETIKVYRFLGDVQSGSGDFAYNLAAAIDTTGVWAPEHVDALTDPGDWEYGRVWREVEYTFIETVDGTLLGLDLGQEMGDNEILAVAYEILKSDGTTVRVGDPAEVNGLDIPGLDQDYRRVKLLKPAGRDPFTFQYVMRNIYSLGGTNIDAASFEMTIEIASPVDQPGQHDDTGFTYLNVFGLDIENAQGQPPADGLVDKHRGVRFDLERGLLLFDPWIPFPFNADQSFYQNNAAAAYPGDTSREWRWEGTRLASNLSPEIYEWDTNPSNYDQYGRFELIPSHASASSSFSLNASNIEEGSETVILDGRTLSRGVDYEINYLFGEVTLKGEAAASLTADSNIQVSYQYAPFFGGGQSSLLGFNVAYDLAPESKLSTTWLYQSNSIVGHKAKLGEEPSRTLVGNLNLNHTLKSSLLTEVANVFTIGRRERESTLQFRGEAAVSMPDPNTKNRAYVEDFEGARSTDLISLTRLGWYQASRPAHGSQDDEGDGLEAAARVPDIRWFDPKPRVERRWLNPELEGQERTETQQALQMFLKKPAGGGWGPGDWGGIMRGVSATGLDLSQAQFVEIWINDYQQAIADRRGILHIDFGVIDEDFSWQRADGSWVTGTFEYEDLNQDGTFNRATEDNGLDAVVRDGAVAESDRGQAYDNEEGSAADPFPAINNTRGNNHEDSEDLDGNTRFDRQNRYYTVSIDLQDHEPLVDVAQLFPGSDLEGTSWRKYRIPLNERVPVGPDGPPDIEKIRHIRVWYEDPEPAAPDLVQLQLSELQFLGSRWQRQGIRKVGSEALVPVDEASSTESFFIGEINNKDNADYRPPFPVREENGIPEKESSLLLDVQDLQAGNMVRIVKQVSVRGDSYSRYENLSWYWRANSSDAADLDVFFRIGADSLNYYEVSNRMIDLPDRLAWRRVEIGLKYLTNIKNNEPGEDGVIRGTIADLGDGFEYDVRIVGEPDLNRITHLHLGVMNRTRRTISGQVWFNDVVLEGVKRDVGLAESIGLQLNLADVLKVDLDWDKRDAEFHGLSQDAGQGYISENWGLSTSLQLENYVPLLGFSMPLSFNRRMSTSRPKYEVNSDIEILDEERRSALSSVEDRNTYSLRLSRRQSRNPFARYLLDPWNLSVNGSTTSRDTPTESSDATTLSGSLSYNVSIPGDHRLADVPVLGVIPLVNGVAYLPTRIEGSASFTSNERTATRRDTQGNTYPADASRTRPGTLSGGIDYRPLTFVTAKFSNRSTRDLLRPHEVGGINIGKENEYSQSLQLSITLPKATQMPQSSFYAPLRAAVRTLNDLRPSIEYDGGYANQYPVRLEPGDPPDLHSVGNSASWRLGGRVPMGNFFKWLVPERKRSQDEQAALIAEQERLQQQRRTEDVFDPGQVEDWDEMTPDQQREAREEWLLEQAERRLEEEQRTGDQPPAESAGPGLGPRDLVEPVFGVLREFEAVQLTYTDRRSSGYGRLQGLDAPLGYRFGFDMTPGFPDSLFDTLRLEDSQDLSLSTSTRITRDARFDLKYSLRRNHRVANEQESWSYGQNWPDLGFSLTGIEGWGLFGGDPRNRDAGWFRQSSLNLSYKQTKDVNNYTRTFYDPRRSTTVTPSWNMTFQNEMSLNLNGSWSSENRRSSGVVTTADRLRVGLQVKHKFRAQRLLARLGLYRPGVQPTVDMTVDLSYSRNAQLVEAPNAAREPDPTGVTIISLQPRFNYNISRNLSGAFTMNYSRNRTIGEEVVSTTIGIGLEATFVF